MDGYGYTPIPPAEASCVIAHLFVELAPPCSCCKREDGVIVIQGTAYDGTGARITIKGEEVRYYGKQMRPGGPPACHTGRWRSGTTPRAGC